MDSKKVGKFIKSLRESKGWSQETLADKMFVDRTKVNKLENGNRNIQLEDIILLSKIFDISVEEILFGEKKCENNEYKLSKMFKEYLKHQNRKRKKIKMWSILGIIIFSILYICLISFYFFQNYNSIKVYKFFGEDGQYTIENGLLILTREKIYFQIGGITPSIDEVEIYSEINNRKDLVYKGSPENIFYDFNGYNSFISYKDFIDKKQKIYIKIDSLEIKLTFVEDFVNDNFLYDKYKKIGESLSSKEQNTPLKIKEIFSCDSNSCSLKKENENLIYSNNFFKIEGKNFYINYDLENQIFEYQKNEQQNTILKFVMLKDETILCDIGDCKNAKKIFLDFQKNYICKYLSE